MKLLIKALSISAAAIPRSVVSSALSLHAQNLEAAQLLNPPPDSWPIYHGDYSGRRHSNLTQITPQNVANLTLDWAFQTNQAAEIKSSPLLVDGILYFTVPDNVWAVDARSGHQIWHYHLALRTRANTSAIAALPCIKAGSTSRRRMPPDFAQRERWQGALERSRCGRQHGLLDHDGAACRRQSRHRRCIWRSR